MTTASLIIKEAPHRVFSFRERKRMGVMQVRVAGADEPPSLLATQASRKALEKAAVDPATLDLVMTAGCTLPDYDMWTMSAKVASNLGALNAECFGVGDVGCASAFAAVRTLLPVMSAAAGPARVLLTAGCVTPGGRFAPPVTIYGDGGGALYLERTDEALPGALRLVRADFYTNCSQVDSAGPAAGLLRLRQAGQLVPDDWTVRARDLRQAQSMLDAPGERGAACIRTSLAKAGWAPEELRWLIGDNLHVTMPRDMGAELGVPEDRLMLVNCMRYGHAWVVDMFANLATLMDEYPLNKGEKVVCTGVGQGEHWGVMLLEG